MYYSTESECPSLPKLHLIEQALNSLKQSVQAHLDQESRLERLCLGWHQNWQMQLEQLRMRIEALEARLSPWMIERGEGPRLAMINHHEDVA